MKPIKILLILLLLSVQGCAITPNLSITHQEGIDIRMEKGNVVQQKFFTTIPTMGTFGIIGLSYSF